MKRFYYIILLGLLISVLFSFLWSYKEQNDMKKDFENQINKIFNSQDKVSDGENNVIYFNIEILNNQNDKKVIDEIPSKFSNSGSKNAKIISKPFVNGFLYVKLSKNNLSYEKDEFNSIEYSMDSIVSSYIVYYGEEVDKFKHLKKGEISEILEDITKQSYNAIVQKNSVSNSPGKLNDIINFSKINNKYYSLEFQKIINNSRNGQIFNEWYDIGDYNLFILKFPSKYKLKENKKVILYDKLKYFGIFFLGYLILSLIIFLITKIVKK